MTVTMLDLRGDLFAGDLIANALNAGSSQPFLHMSDGEVLSVRQVRDLTSQYIEVFKELGIGSRARVGVLSTNRPEVLIINAVGNILGPCLVPLHPMGSVDDFVYALEDAEIEALVFEAGRFDPVVEELIDRIPKKIHYLALGDSPFGEDLIRLAESMPTGLLKPETFSPDDPARMSYSGGTTGKPKAIVATQRNVMYAVTIMMAEWEWPETPRMLVCSPLSHAGAAVFLPVLLKGGSLVVLPGFEPESVMRAIQSYSINTTLVVPTMLYALMDHPSFGKFDLSSLETVFYGSSLILPTRLQEAIRKFGNIFFQFYGQAEAPMTVAVLRKDEHDPDDLDRLSCCGRPVPWIRVELLDDDGLPVAEGLPGEICVRGPLVMDGYYNKPDETAEALSGGWLHTGDVAVMDSHGFLRIVDRKKDMIVTGGFNVYPREIEQVISTHPGVADCAVVGIAHQKWGEAVTAFVVEREGAQVNKSELQALVKKKKGAIHTPKDVRFIAAIPLTAVGKPDKKALRQF